MAEKEQNKIKFVEETEESLANAIRRYFNEIPVLAIEEIEVFKNDSALFDETIAHRLGLVPLKMEKAVADGGVKLKLVASKESTVYSKELKGSVKPVYENIPLALLNKDQELEIVAEAKFGKGSQHAKFSPGLMFYKNLVELKTGSNGKEVSEILSNCPNKCGNGNKVDNNKTLEMEICDSCEQDIEKIGVELIPTNKLVVYVESFGQIPVKNLVPLAIKELKKDLDLVAKKI